MSSSKTPGDTQKFIKAVADHKGWILNRDSEYIEFLVNGLTVNHERYGFYQCPCRDSYGDKVKDKDIHCPCEYAAADIQEYGQCFCGLFLDADYYSSHEDVDGIPERRPDELFPD